VASAVVGGEVPTLRAARAGEVQREEPVLSVRGLSCEGVRDVTLDLRPGEVLGIAGVEGNGQRPLFEAIAGILPLTAGRITLSGRDVTGDSALSRRAHGLGFVPEDREGTGLCYDLSIAENLCLGDPVIAAGDGALSPQQIESRARDAIARYDIRPPDPRAPVRALSGGNAQKVLVARELDRPLRALLLAQPTRGVDLGAATAIRQHVLDARDKGLAVLLVSSELDELRALSDRVAVMCRGSLVAVMPVQDATDAALGPLMIGATPAEASR
jgi:simple sugar transport system ATP-binding protein